MTKPAMLPQRREKALLIEELPAETMVYDTTNHKVHCLNPVARLVWRHCNRRTTEAKMVEILSKDLDIPADDALVQLTLEKLARAGLLETEEQTWFANSTSRRQAVKSLAKFGIAAAAALVATIAAPAAAQAASGDCAATPVGGCCPLGCTKADPCSGKHCGKAPCNNGPGCGPTNNCMTCG